VRAFEIWHGIEAPYNAMKKALLGGFWWQKQRLQSTEQSHW
jgi:hypothetical protein